MMQQCPICRGSKESIPNNGVDPKDDQPRPCYFCDGTGEVEEQPTDKIHIYKYWGTMSG